MSKRLNDSLEKAINTCDFRAAKSIIGDEVVGLCSAMINLLTAIRNKAASDVDENRLKSINEELIKANNIIRKL